jgi:hypothetical protein
MLAPIRRPTPSGDTAVLERNEWEAIYFALLLAFKQ